MKYIKKSGLILLGVIFTLFISCEDFIEIETPNHLLDNSTVFANDQTTEAALNGLYNQLFNAAFANGASQSVSFVAGLSSDDYELTTTTPNVVEFYQNQITPENGNNLILWSSAYNIIYQANSLIEGVINNNQLDNELIDRVEGSSRFIRAFTYFNLVNLYGDVPIVEDTNYSNNASLPRSTVDEVYDFIIEDLEIAIDLLNETYISNERTQVNAYVPIALLARVHLYLGNWAAAEEYSSQLISNTALYDILDNPNEVFLANSKEAIWQISPIGWGNSFTHTREGNLLIKTPTTNTPVELSDSILESFDDVDLRYQNWIGKFDQNNDTLEFPYKYKIQFDASGGPIEEYSMVLRVAEQFLIRAEARFRLGNIEGAIEDINTLKSRAGIPILDSVDIIPDELPAEILLERQRELFSEWGHRWFDLKRLGEAEILTSKPNSFWDPTANLFPIPQQERLKNTSLTQNPGY